jgi:tRNA(adenine34) deaminase
MEREFLPEKRYMLQALALAREAAQAGEVPVGAVVVREGQVLGQGRNRREALGSALAHAEIEALAQACRTVGDWRLTGAHLYVTLEPCPMCAGAAVNARVARIIFGAEDEGLGCCGTAADLLRLPAAPAIQVFPGFYGEEAQALLQAFFRSLR